MSDTTLPHPAEVAAAQADGASRLHVGYVLKQYPRLSETFILNEILGLEAAGPEVTIFSLRHATEGRFHPAIASVQAPVHYIPRPDKGTFLEALRALPGLRQQSLPDVLAFLDRLPADRRSTIALQAIAVAHEATRAEIDHLHAHFLTVAAHTVYVAHLLTGVPYSVTAHAKDIYRHTVDWGLAATIAEGAAAIVTVCDANLRYLSHRLDGTTTNLVRIYNGLDPHVTPDETIERSNNIVLGVGRLVEKKGFDLALRAFAGIAPERPDVRLVLVGDGDQRAELERLSAELGLADRVEFTGALPQNEVGEWLARASVMIAPCRVGADGNQDALPTVLLEAMRAGLPAVATPVAGIPEIIEHEVEGLIVPCDDAQAVADATIRLLGDADLRRSMSVAGPAKIATRFDRERSISELISTFTPASPSSL